MNGKLKYIAMVISWSQSLREKCQCDDIFVKYPEAVAIETEGEGTLSLKITLG